MFRVGLFARVSTHDQQTPADTRGMRRNAADCLSQSFLSGGLGSPYTTKGAQKCGAYPPAVKSRCASIQASPYYFTAASFLVEPCHKILHPDAVHRPPRQLEVVSIVTADNI